MLNTRAFREVVRSVTVSYPVPFMFVAMLAFALACLGGALAIDGALRWLLAGIGSLFAVAALFVVLYAILRDPRLLRSERSELAHRTLDLIGDSDMDEASRVRLLEGAVPQILGESVSKRQIPDPGDRRQEGENEDGNV